MKRITSILLAVLLALGAFSVVSFGAEDTESEALKFGDDGKFTVLHLTDIQDSFIFNIETRKYINDILSMTEPDLVVLGGDNIEGSGNWFKFLVKIAINSFMNIFEQRGVKVAAVFGNHDDEGAASKQEMMAMYEEYDCFVGSVGFTDGERVGTYSLPILSSDESNIAFNIWMMDSGTYKNLDPDEGYAAVNAAQIEWYKEESLRLQKENGKKVPSLMFQHIVVAEIYDALKVVDAGTEGAITTDASIDRVERSYVLPDGAKGVLEEQPCPGFYNEGQFEAVKERGDVLAIITGHDHKNTFEIEHEGVYLINSPCVGTASYHSEETIGARVFVLDENKAESFETYLINRENAKEFIEEEIIPDCDCLCHSAEAEAKFRIKRIFWSVFKNNQTCSCGAVHF